MLHGAGHPPLTYLALRSNSTATLRTSETVLTVTAAGKLLTSSSFEEFSEALGPAQSTQNPAPGHLKTTMSATVTTELEQAIANSTITDEDLATYRRDG